MQYVQNALLSPLLKQTEKTYIQAVTGTLLYYAWAIDPTILTTLNAVATQQALPTQERMKEVKQLLDYCACQEEAIITYRTTKMILAVHGDAGYLDVQYLPNNGAVLNISKVIDAVVSLAAEAKLGALFINAQETVYL